MNTQLKIRGIAVAITFGILLSACGGGGGGSPSAPAAPPAPKPVQVTMAGDSTAIGVSLTSPGAYTITDDPRTDLQADLQSTLGSTVTVVTNAVGGTTLADMLAGTNFPMPFQQYLSSTSSAIITENFGLNDRSVTSADAFRSELIQFVTMVKAAGKTPVLEEPNPVCNLPTGMDSEHVYADGQTVSTFVDVIDSVGAQEQVQVIHQYSLMKELPVWCNLLSDGTEHPTPAGYLIKAQNAAVVLAPLVKSLQ